MSQALAYGRAALAVSKRDLLIFVSYRGRLIGQFLAAAATVTLFYYVSRLVDTPQFPTPEDYFAFALIGLIFLRALVSAFTVLAATLRQELVAGTYERMVTSPFGPMAGAAAMTIFPLALALFLGVATAAFATLAFDAPLQWSTLPLALAAAALVGLSLVPFFLLLTAALVLLKQAAAAARFLIVAISVVAGFYFPVELLPGWARWASEVQPFTAAVDLLRHLLVDTPLQHPVSELVLKVAIFTVVLGPLSLLALRGAIEASRRRGTLIEY